MPGIEVDQEMINEIARLKQIIRGSINGVMDGSLTAGHLASDVTMLLEVLDRLPAAPGGAPPVQEAAPAAEVQPPAQEAAPAVTTEQAQQPVQEAPAQPAQEATPAEQPQVEQPAPETTPAVETPIQGPVPEDEGQ